MCVHIGQFHERKPKTESILLWWPLTDFTYVHIVITGNKMNNKYRTLNKALEVVGFENATVCCNVATYSFKGSLNSFNHLDTNSLDSLCMDLKKQCFVSISQKIDMQFELQFHLSVPYMVGRFLARLIFFWHRFSLSSQTIIVFISELVWYTVAKKKIELTGCYQDQPKANDFRLGS